MTTSEFFIYIPGEGDWSISLMNRQCSAPPRRIVDERQARAVYLQWSKRKRLPAGAKIWSRTTRSR